MFKAGELVGYWRTVDGKRKFQYAVFINRFSRMLQVGEHYLELLEQATIYCFWHNCEREVSYDRLCGVSLESG